MNLTQIQYFKKIAETLHYAKAAEVLGVAQSSLSRAMTSLEDELNVPLFEKSGRNIQLTKYGKAFYKYVKEAVDSLELGIAQIHSLADPIHGEINIGLTFPLGPEIVPQILRRFSEKSENKNFQVHLFQNSTIELLKLLKDDVCDVVLCSYVDHEPEITFVPLMRSRLIAIVPLNHPLAKKDSVTLKELAEYSFILNSEKAPMILERFQNESLDPTVLSKVQGECAIAGLVSIGYGVSLVDAKVNLTNISVKTLQVPELDDLKIYTCMAYIKEKWQSQPVKALINFLETEIKEENT